MKEKEFIIAEVKKHLSASIKSSKYEIIEVAKNMPTFEGVYITLLRFHNGRREIPGRRRTHVHLLRRVQRVL